MFRRNWETVDYLLERLTPEQCYMIGHEFVLSDPEKVVEKRTENLESFYRLAHQFGFSREEASEILEVMCSE